MTQNVELFDQGSLQYRVYSLFVALCVVKKSKYNWAAVLDGLPLK
jgi:hypothetical protein